MRNAYVEFGGGQAYEKRGNAKEENEERKSTGLRTRHYKAGVPQA